MFSLKVIDVQFQKDDDTCIIDLAALFASQYYTKVSIAESCMKDKKLLVAHGEYGKDEDST